VVAVGVAVDQVGDGLVGDFGDRFWDMGCIGWGRIDDDDPVFIRHEHGLIRAVRDHVHPFAELLGPVRLGRVD
jgi:hypothetical protein